MAGSRRNTSVRYGRTSTLCRRALCTIGYNVAAVRPPFALPKKQEILSSDSDRPQEPFDAVGVEWDAAVFEEALESFPAVAHVVDRFRQFGRRTQFRAEFEELRAQPLEDRGSRKTRTVAGRRPRNRRGRKRGTFWLLAGVLPRERPHKVECPPLFPLYFLSPFISLNGPKFLCGLT